MPDPYPDPYPDTDLHPSPTMPDPDGHPDPELLRYRAALPTSTPTPTPTPAPGAARTTTTLDQPAVRVPHLLCTILGTALGTQVPHGDCSLLAATVAPSGAIGTVQFTDSFHDKTTALGQAQIRPDGLALLITNKLARGEHSLTATFIPKDPSAFQPSTSNTVTVTVTRSDDNQNTGNNNGNR